MKARQLVGGTLLIAMAATLSAQDARSIVQEAVKAELASNRNDHSTWRYVVSEVEPAHNTYAVVETEHGAIRRHLEENGQPVSAATAKADNERIQSFIHDPGLQAKQRKDGAHDDRSAEELLNLLPTAFDWKIESETPQTVTLSFRPHPDFHPPDMEARVMGSMVGTLIVDKGQHRIRTMKGALGDDIGIGFGLLGKLHKGGTFNVERRQISPGLWQITETHVHIDGKALMFKTIGQQQDEVKTNFVQVPPGTTLDQAVGLLDEVHPSGK